ncbi:MAG: virulence-related protein [Negativicutes bacterium]|nr:virulence-related protein [Negativicutes bacterium]
MFKLQMRVTGRERKEVAGLIASHFKTQAVYEGVPSFGYLIREPIGREWRVDKTGAILTEGTAKDNLAGMFTVLKAMEESGVEAIGQAEVTISTEGHNGITLRNLINILAAKEQFITKVTGAAGHPFIDQEMVTAVNDVRLKTVGDFLEAVSGKGCPGIVITKDTLTFSWFIATLNPEAIQAYIHLAFAVNRLALAQKHSSPRETETANEKYTFRVWLLRLGFIGEEYKTSRKMLLDRLSGDGSFRTQDQAQEAVRKRKDRRNESRAVV